MTDTLVRPAAATGHQRLRDRMARGAAFLGCDYAIMAGAMSWVSERNLVAAMSNAGGFGVIACGAMTVALLDREIAATKALTERAVRGQFDHHASRSDRPDRGLPNA